MTSEWLANFSDPDLNNFRQNVQGGAAAGSQPDITGDVDEGVCQTSGDARILTATVCNRGTRTVGASMPATFYVGEPTDENILCVSYTEGPVPRGWMPRSLLRHRRGDQREDHDGRQRRRPRRPHHHRVQRREQLGRRHDHLRTVSQRPSRQASLDDRCL